MNRSEKALHYFNNSFNCSQSVLTAFAPELGISEDDSLKIACAFGAGMGRMQRTCGAVTGALMAIGLQHGKALKDDESKKQHTYALTRAFCEAFLRKHGSLNCRELLLDLDMNDPDENLKIKELGLHDTHCSRFVKDAVELIENLYVINGKP
jgi:C_GCAxxG_C_C family probable redox protein